MQIKRILIHVRRWNAQLCLATGRALQEMTGCEDLVFCSMYHKPFQFIEQQGETSIYLMPKINEVKITEVLRQRAIDLDQQLLENGQANLNMMLEAERFSPATSKEREDFLLQHLAVLDDLIIDGTLNITFSIDHLIFWLSAELARVKKGYNFSYIPCGVPQNRVMGLKNPWEQWERTNPPDNPEELLKKCRERLEMPVEKRLIYMQPRNRPRYSQRREQAQVEFQSEKIDRKHKNYFYRESLLKDNFVVGKLTQILSPAKPEYYEPDVTDLQNVDFPFIYIPLHLQPEMTVELYSPWFSNQIEQCRLISQAMPFGWKLLVKENPKMHGRRPENYYEELKEIHNLLIVKGNVPSLDLVKQAEITVTLSGTAAMEALLLGKRSLLFGHAPYRYLTPYGDFAGRGNLTELTKILTEKWKVEMDMEAWSKHASSTIDCHLIPLWQDDKFYYASAEPTTIAKLTDFVGAILQQEGVSLAKPVA